MRKVILWVAIFLASSFVLNQLSGAFLGRHALNIIALFIIPMAFAVIYPDKEIKTAAKIALLPGLLFLILYYVIRPLLLQ